MKKVLLFVAIAVFVALNSCSKSSSTNEDNDIIGTWEMTEMTTVPQTTAISSETLTGSNLPFTQLIKLKANGTYVKTRLTKTGEKIEIQGTYSDRWLEGERYISLLYSDELDNPLSESCFGSGESLIYNTGKLINNFWPACDGSYTLKYKKRIVID
ncbi:MAG: hypothetical protein ACK5NK_00305 [Niabella sp.]